jgi:uracil-DNA glycosylase family 4
MNSYLAPTLAVGSWIAIDPTESDIEETPVPPDADTLRRTRQSLEALRAAGLEWLPRIAAPPSLQRHATAEATPTMPIELFDANNQPAVTPDQRRRELGVLSETVSKCMKCSELCSTRTQTVFGVGPLDVDVCFVGEAPGADEDKQGEPFVGAAGQLLNKIIEASGFRRDQVYICNTIKCRPPGNRTPKPEETANCREYFDKQLALVKPKYLVALGGTAAQNMLATTVPIGKLRGKFHDFRGIPLMVTYHPAYLLPHRAPHMKGEVWADMKMLLTKMGRPIPEVKKS